MSLSLCLYVCCKHMPLCQNQIFKIPITFYNARHQQSSRVSEQFLNGTSAHNRPFQCHQSSRTVELVDHTYDGRHVARCTHTSIDRNALTALLRSRVGLLWTLFLQLCSSWQDFVWYSVSCSLSAVKELLGYSRSFCHLSIAQVLSRLCLPDFF